MKISHNNLLFALAPMQTNVGSPIKPNECFAGARLFKKLLDLKMLMKCSVLYLNYYIYRHAGCPKKRNLPKLCMC